MSNSSKKKKKDKKPQIAILLRRLRSDPDHVNDFEVIGQCERAALAASLKLAVELDAEVTAVAVGTAKREDRVLAMALRAGCDRGVRIFDRKVDKLDYLGIAQVLAAGIKRLDADLVVCGDRSEDELQGAIGPAVAEILGIPHLTGLVDVHGEGKSVVARHRAAGQFHTFRCSWPLLLCVHSFPRARHPHHGNERGRSRGSIDNFDLAALDLDIRSLSYRTRLVGSAHPRRSGRNATMADSVSQLVNRLHEDHLLS